MYTIDHGLLRLLDFASTIRGIIIFCIDDLD